MAPKAANAVAALHPEPSLSRAWPAPTSLAASTAPVGGAHGPESGECHGSASPGTIAFAGMARSYEVKPTAGGASANRQTLNRKCMTSPSRTT